MPIGNISSRVKEDPHLRALYGKLVGKDGATPPTEADILLRTAPPMPAVEPGEIELVDMITDAERKLHLLGLKGMGLPDDLLKHIKGLDKLASSTGHFIAMALEKTCRNYYVLLLNLTDLANKTHAQLMIKEGEKGFLTWEGEPRAFHNRNYIEMVKEAGRAFDLMLKAGEAMVKMMMDGKELDGPNGRKKKHGWEIKKVEPTFKQPRQPMPT